MGSSAWGLIFVGLYRALTLGANRLGGFSPNCAGGDGPGWFGGAVVGRHMGKKKALDGVGPLVERGVEGCVIWLGLYQCFVWVHFRTPNWISKRICALISAGVPLSVNKRFILPYLPCLFMHEGPTAGPSYVRVIQPYLLLPSLVRACTP